MKKNLSFIDFISDLSTRQLPSKYRSVIANRNNGLIIGTNSNLLDFATMSESNRDHFSLVIFPHLKIRYILKRYDDLFVRYIIRPTLTSLSEHPVTNRLPFASTSSPFTVPDLDASSSRICAPSKLSQ